MCPVRTFLVLCYTLRESSIGGERMQVPETQKVPTNFAESYERTLVPVIFQPWARELIRRVTPQDGEHILDLA